MNNQHQRGFTLIEMMISMFIGLIILGGTITAYQTISDVREYRDNNDKLQDEIMYIHRALASSVKVAKSISIENDGEGSRLILESYSGEDINQIKCPGSDNGSDRIEWMTEINNNDRDFKCKAGGDRKEVSVLKLPSEESASEEEGAEERAGISSISFECPSYEPCEQDEKLKSVIVIIDYYDRECDPNEKECDSKSMSFHLATRNPEG